MFRGEITSELGNVSPVLVVPALFSDDELTKPQAKVAKTDSRLKDRIADALEDALDELSAARIAEERGGGEDDGDDDADE